MPLDVMEGKMEAWAKKIKETLKLVNIIFKAIRADEVYISVI